MAERSGLVLGMGERIQRMALSFRAHCGLPADGGLMISVNLSERELLDPSLAPRLHESLQTLALAPEVLLCEIPERVIAEHPDRTAAAMGALWDVGIACVLDDLGSGALAPSVLRSLPLVAAKVDIVAAQRTEETLSSQMRTIDLATSLGITVIGKRVARYQDLELLTWLDLNFAQGHAFGAPAPAGVFQGMLVDAGLVPTAVPAERPRPSVVLPRRRNGLGDPLEAPSSA
jgi:EAL domain-containing protein (putative c-di-GMP-specific phosphodiesterase class I)